jgi:hypothetical protein
MVKKLRATPITADDEVVVIAGAWFKHNGVQVHPNDRVRMSKAEAHELKLLHMIRQPTPGELA